MNALWEHRVYFNQVAFPGMVAEAPKWVYWVWPYGFIWEMMIKHG